MKVTKTDKGYRVDLTDAEAKEIYTEMGMRVAMGNCGFLVHETLALMVAREVERQRSPKKKGK